MDRDVDLCALYEELPKTRDLFGVLDWGLQLGPPYFWKLPHAHTHIYTHKPGDMTSTRVGLK